MKIKAKRLVAIATAIMLVVFPTSAAYADDSTSIGDANTAGSTSQSSDATVDYINAKDFVRIAVPTSASLDFTLDPVNLAGTLGAGTWTPSQGGAIIPAAIAQIVNKSAVPVKAQVSFTLVDGSATPSTLVNSATGIDADDTKKMFLTVTPAKVKTSIVASGIPTKATVTYVMDGGGDPAIFTAAQLAAANVKNTQLVALADADTATLGKYVCTTTGMDALTAEEITALDLYASALEFNQVEVPVIEDTGVLKAAGGFDGIDPTIATTITQYNATTGGLASTTVNAVAANGLGIAYAMNSASYYISKGASGFVLKYDDVTTNTNFDTGSFIIGGRINPNADWSGYDATHKLTLSAKYTFDTMTTADYNTVTDADDGVVISGTHNSIPYVAPVEDIAKAVTIGTAAPVAGAAMADGTNAAPTHATGPVVTWSSDGGTTYAAATGNYASTTTYKTKYVYTADAGYQFDAAIATSDITVTDGTVSSAVVSGTNNETLTVIVTWTATVNSTIAKAVTIGTEAPVTNAAMADGTNAAPTNSTGPVVTWSSDGGTTYAEATGNYAGSTTYKTKYVYTAASSYEFDPTIATSDITVTDGTVSSATVSGTNNDTLTVIVTWPATGNITIAKTVTIGTTAPVANATIADGTSAAPTHATGPVVTWSSDGGTTYAEATGSFAGATAYKTKYVYTAVSSYEFDPTIATSDITVTGGTVSSATVSGTNNDTLTVIVTWPATAAALGFTDAGSVSSTSSKTFNVSKTAPADTLVNFNFGGQTMALKSMTGATTYALTTDYTVAASSFTVKATRWTTLIASKNVNDTASLQVVVNGVIYTLNYKVVS